MPKRAASFTILSLLMLAGLMLSACNGNKEEAPLTPMGPGQALFVQHCAACHRGAGNMPNRVVLHSPTLASEEGFRQLLRHPDSGLMPPFPETSLSDAEVRELYAYILSVRETHASSGQ